MAIADGPRPAIYAVRRWAPPPGSGPLPHRLPDGGISTPSELLADASGVELTRDPLGLASALRKIAADPGGMEIANRATQHLFVVNPLKSFGMESSSLFSTHPPIEARIRILEAMA